MSIIGLNASVLTSWFNSQISASVASNSSFSSLSASSGTASDVEAPWDVTGDNLASLEDLARKVLATNDYFLDPDDEWSSEDAADDHKSLFSLYQGLKRMMSIAEMAKEGGSASYSMTYLANQFQNGLDQLDTFLDDTSFDELSVLKGEELSEVESEVAIARTSSNYYTGTVHDGALTDEVAALTGSDIEFTVSVTKSGVTSDVLINLDDMGTTERTMENIAAHINSELDAAGVISTFYVEKLGEEDENGIIPGNEYGFRIFGVSTETLSFSATQSDPALYMTGISGIYDSASGQIAKFTDLSNTDPTMEATARLEAEASVTEIALPGGEDGETYTDEENNPLEIHASVADPSGGLLVVGSTTNTVDGQPIKGEQDLVLAKYDSNGSLVWSRVFGAGETAEGTAISVDDSGNIIVAGNISGDLTDTTDLGGQDAIVASFSSAGVEQWSQRFGGSGDETVTDVEVDASGNIYVVGGTTSSFGDMTNGGGTDGFVRALDSTGSTLYTRGINGTGDERVAAATIADDGGLLLAFEEDNQAVIRKYDTADGTSAASWEVNLGDLEDGKLGDIAADATGIYITGAAGSSFAPSAPIGTGYEGGVRDAFLVKLTDGASATVDYTTFIGSSDDDTGNALTLDNGTVYIVGKTSGELEAGAGVGDRDAFAVKVDGASGAVEWTSQISGFGGVAEATSVALGTSDDSILSALGLPNGDVVFSDSRVVTAKSAAREGDHFYISVNGGSREKIEIDADDTMRALTFKINAALVLDGAATVIRDTDGDRLEISVAEGSTIELFAGAEGEDLLKALGVQAGAITDPIDDSEDGVSDSPPIYALELPTDINLDDEDQAQLAYEALEAAMNILQRAYGDITRDPALAALLEGPTAGKTGGTVPAYLNAQLANYQAGLQRLSSANPSAGGLFL